MFFDERIDRREAIKRIALMGLLGAEVFSLAECTTFDVVRIEGVATVFDTDAKMEDMVEYHTGTTGAWVMNNNKFQQAILNARKIEDLIKVQGLINNRRMFDAAIRYNKRLLEVMKGTIQTKRMIAVDGYRFGTERHQLATGGEFVMVVKEKVDKDGKIAKLTVPQRLTCYNWDVLAYDSKGQFFSDVNPYFYRTVLGATWSSARRHFYTESGRSIAKLPRVSLEYNKAQFA